jgi:RNA polymerase sigma factor (sigma-70 family)
MRLPLGASRVTQPAEAVRTVEDVFVALAPAVLGYLRSAGAVDSENVLGDVFVRVTRGLNRFQGTDADLRRWVFTIAFHCLVDEQRREHRQRLLLRRRSVPATSSAPDEPLDRTLVDALARLTPDQQQVITLRFVADLSLEDVAGLTNRPVGAVKSLQHRALHNLAELVPPPDA